MQVSFRPGLMMSTVSQVFTTGFSTRILSKVWLLSFFGVLLLFSFWRLLYGRLIEFHSCGYSLFATLLSSEK